MHNAPMAILIRVTKGVQPYADHVTVTLGGEPVECWFEADEMNSWIVIEPATPVDRSVVRFGTFNTVVITLNDNAPAAARKAYKAARTMRAP